MVVPAPSRSVPRRRWIETWMTSSKRALSLQSGVMSSSGSSLSRSKPPESQERPSNSSSVRTFQYCGRAAFTRATSAPVRPQRIGP
jgi:hypothetical protein